MKRKFKISILTIGLFLFYYIYNNYFTASMIAGIYVSNNKDEFYIGQPKFGDSLILFKNNHFTSETWGDGTYRLSYSLKGTEINLTYKYELGGKAIYGTYIYRSSFGEPRIIIIEDLNYYFEKVK